MKLNLGGGKEFKKGYINVDIEDFSALSKDFIQHDLEKPLPFKDDSIDGIYCKGVLEHIFNLSQLLREIFRVCKHDAEIHFILPHFTNNTFEFHIRPFRYWMFKEFCLEGDNVKRWTDNIYFHKVKRKLTFKSIYSFMNLINISHFLIKIYEFSFLRSLFFAHGIEFEGKIYKVK